MGQSRVNIQALMDTAKALIAGDKGLLAMDESTPTCNKRFAAAGIPQTEEARRSYRELIVTTPGLGECINGAILYDETIRQRTDEGKPFVKVLADAGIIAGIKVDLGAKDMATRAEGFGMQAFKVDGCDFFAVYKVMTEAIALCRTGKGPVAVEFDTERFYGHFEGDPQKYRGADEVSRARETRDCIKNFRATVQAQNLLDIRELDAIDAEVETLIDLSVKEALAAPPPGAEYVTEDVYVTY